MKFLMSRNDVYRVFIGFKWCKLSHHTRDEILIDVITPNKSLVYAKRPPAGVLGTYSFRSEPRWPSARASVAATLAAMLASVSACCLCMISCLAAEVAD